MSNNMGTQNASVYWTGYEIHSCLKIWATKISCVLDKGYTSLEPQLCVLRLHCRASALRLSRSPPDLRTMHLYLLMLRFEDAFQAVNASLRCFHGLEGCVSPWKSIPQRTFHRIEMHPSLEKHPAANFSSNRDASAARKTSSAKDFIEQGCFPSLHFSPTVVSEESCFTRF